MSFRAETEVITKSNKIPKSLIVQPFTTFRGSYVTEVMTPQSSICITWTILTVNLAGFLEKGFQSHYFWQQAGIRWMRNICNIKIGCSTDLPITEVLRTTILIWWVWRLLCKGHVMKLHWVLKVVLVYKLEYLAQLRKLCFYRDALITCAVNTGTALIAGVLVFSILGYMANLQASSPQVENTRYLTLIKCKSSGPNKINKLSELNQSLSTGCRDQRRG